MPTPFENDCARKLGASGNDATARRLTCANCGILRTYHLEGTCRRWRRMTDREWQDWCGILGGSEPESRFTREVIEVTESSIANLYYLRLQCGHITSWMWEFDNGKGHMWESGAITARKLMPKTHTCSRCAAMVLRGSGL